MKPIKLAIKVGYNRFFQLHCTSRDNIIEAIARANTLNLLSTAYYIVHSIQRDVHVYVTEVADASVESKCAHNNRAQ